MYKERYGVSKDFYLSIIPVSNADWYKVLRNISLTTKLNDSAYYCMRFFDELEGKELPRFVPNYAINLDGDIKFRIVVCYPVLNESDKSNSELVLCPWADDAIPYKEASWMSVGNIIRNHSEYALILRPYSMWEKDAYLVDDVVKICEAAGRKYKVINDWDSFRYKDAYNYFFKEESGK
jgi:hypothetical protein